MPPETASAAEPTRGLHHGTLGQPALLFSGHWHQRKSQECVWGKRALTAAHIVAHEGSWAGKPFWSNGWRARGQRSCRSRVMGALNRLSRVSPAHVMDPWSDLLNYYGHGFSFVNRGFFPIT